MKYSKVIPIISAVITLFSCNKEKVDINSYPATVNLINAIASYDSEIKMNFTQGDYTYANGRTLSYFYYDGRFLNGAVTFGVPVGAVPLNIALSNDTTKSIYSQSVNFASGDAYSLFMTGYRQSPTALLVKDEIPVRSDVTTGIRFVNLSPNSVPLSANVAGEPMGSLLSNLAYKGVSDFKSLPATPDKNDYFIEIADSNTGEVLTGFYYYDLARMKNITLVIRGVVYGDPGLEVVRINNY